MSYIFAILLFSFLIFIHELGHFIAAKAFGVQVNEFSLFMGPAIFKKQVGQTLYSIRCIPIGGFCAMEGEDEASDNPHAFPNAAWWKRVIILAAGAAMNFLTGVVLLACFFAPDKQFILPTVSEVDPRCSFAESIQPGDRIVSLDGEKIYVYSDFSLILSLNPGDVHDLVLERNGEKVVLNDLNMESRISRMRTAPFLSASASTLRWWRPASVKPCDTPGQPPGIRCAWSGCLCKCSSRARRGWRMCRAPWAL